MEREYKTSKSHGDMYHDVLSTLGSLESMWIYYRSFVKAITHRKL